MAEDAPPVFDPGKYSGGGGTTSTKKKSGGGSTVAYQQQYQQSLASTYMGLWGVAPPPGYVERAAKSGMNVIEFEAHERAKPAFERSPRYQEERVMVESQLSRLLGGLG